MGKDFHSVTVFLRVCCTMIHGFHAVGRYMHCVCTHSLQSVCCYTAESRSFSGVPQCLTSVTSSTFRHFLLSASTFLLLFLAPASCCHSDFLSQSVLATDTPQIEHFPSSPAKLHLVRLHADSPLLWFPFSSSSQRETVDQQARLLCLFHNWLLAMFHLRDGQSSLFASACPLMPLWLSEEAFTTN